MIPVTEESFQLLHEGTVALAKIESAGICVDVDYINRKMAESKKSLVEMKAELETTDVMKLWRKRYGSKFSFNSREQLGTILFDEMGFTAPKTTETGRDAADEDALSTVNHPFVQKYLKIDKLDTGTNKYLKGILREVVHGKIHTFFDLGNAATYRSTARSPNFQNMPIRDPLISSLVRSAFLPRKGRQIVEIDFSGAEVRVAAAYHQDPTMISYILDPTKDMHRDTAMEIYKLKKSEVTKEIRHRAKNKFVFPEFYGSYYIQCAPALWADIGILHTTSGRLLQAHLDDMGLSELGALNPKEKPEPGTFEHHVQKVEHSFWNDRFPVYTQWKKDWYQDYLGNGWFLTKTGFVCQGFMRRNQVINYPVQGSSFHCLLWAMNRIVNRELAKRGMKSIVVGQIHDSIVFDVVPSELAELLEMARDIMVTKLKQHWQWLIVPMECEPDVASVGAPWSEKKAYKFAA